MKEVLVLCTGWKEDYWEGSSTVRYPRKPLNPVQHLKNASPIPGIGVYIKHRGSDFSSKPPCFLIVRDMSENEKGESQFDTGFISEMEGVTSSRLLDEIGFRDLFFSVPGEKVLGVLSKLNVKIPFEWRRLLEEASLAWRDWVGKRFQMILEPASNQDYEERVAEVFRALGFEVEQVGYRREGEYPDGIIYSKDFAIVYDCKNRANYFLDARDKRAMINYVQQAKRRIEEQRGISKVYFAFIAPSYGRVENLSDIEKESSTKGALFTSEALLYLLFKKLSLGRSFLMADFERLVSSRVITRGSIERVYGEAG